MIDFSRAFDSAWERMMVILFRPFDLSKWFVIGFSAFLAGLLSGGNGNVNFSSPFNNQGHFSTPNQPAFNQSMNHALAAFSAIQAGVIVLIVTLALIFGLALAVLIYWLGARGQFLFLDNIVRNRGAIAAPWNRYARQANRVFFFQLICLAIGFAIMLVLVVPAVLIALPAILHHHWPEGAALLGLIAIGIVYLVIAILFACFVFLFREWGVPLIFRNDLTLGAAVREIWALIQRRPGSAVVFVLLRVALAVGLIFISLLVCCLTCCLAGLPYLGTVVLLPVLVYLKCFSLDCLAQFGPAYDVWTVDVPAAPPQGGSLPG